MLTGQIHSSMKLFPMFQTCKPPSFLPFHFFFPLNTFPCSLSLLHSLPFFLSTAFPLFPSLPIPFLSIFTFLSPPSPSSPVPSFLFCSSSPPSFLHFLPRAQLSLSQFTISHRTHTILRIHFFQPSSVLFHSLYFPNKSGIE